jgi:hypothetical protein
MFKITAETVQRIFPKAVRWVAQMEHGCMRFGKQLSPQSELDAQAIGVQQIGLVRIRILSEIPLPYNSELRHFILQSGLGGNIGMAVGHGIVLRDGHDNRYLIAHELGHVLQYERMGGIEPFLVAYAPEVLFPPYYPNGPLEQEAKLLANVVCANALTHVTDPPQSSRRIAYLL